MSDSAVIYVGPGDIREILAYDFHKMDVEAPEGLEWPLTFISGVPTKLDEVLASALIEHDLVAGEFQESTVEAADEYQAAIDEAERARQAAVEAAATEEWEVVGQTAQAETVNIGDQVNVGE